MVPPIGNYCFEDSPFRKKLFSPLKNIGYVPEKGSEIFVSGIPSEATLYDLLKFFQEIGELYQIKLMTKPNGIHNRGFGYVTYMNKQLAQRALCQLSEKPFMNFTYLSMQKSVDNCRIFVSGVPIAKSKDEIWQYIKNTYKVNNIVDVITYRNYGNPTQNRGFVFLEFRTHEDASYFRARYWDKLYLFGRKMVVDWSIPTTDSDEGHLTKVKILFIRNLDVTQTSEEFAAQVYQLMDRSYIEKVYKFKNYAYVHLTCRIYAERLMEQLKHFYQGSLVEISFAKPPNKFTDRKYRDNALISRRTNSPPDGSSDTLPPSPAPSVQRNNVSRYPLYYGSPISPPSMSHSEIVSPNTYQGPTLRDTRNSFLHSSTPRPILPPTRPTGFAATSSYHSYGPDLSSLAVSNASYAPIRMPLRTALSHPISGPSYLDPYQLARGPATSRMGTDIHMPAFPRGFAQDTSAELEDLVTNILRDV